MKKILFALAIVLGVFALFNSDSLLIKLGIKEDSTKAQPERREEASVKVIAAPVQSDSNDRIFEALGTGRALQSIQIYPAVADEVTAINFKAQQSVKKGDILIQLDDREEVLAVQRAEVEMKDAKSLLDRYEKAGKQGAVPESEVDSAKATYEGAQFALETAKLELEQRKIIAPFDGVVGIPSIDVGDRVDTTTLITGLDNRSAILVDFEIPESLASALDNNEETAQKITATTPAYPHEVFEGIILAQESRIDPERRTMSVRARIENDKDLLRPGMSFQTRWQIDGDDYLSVPEIATQWGREGAYIWLVRDNKADQVIVKVMARRSGMVLFEGDVKVGEPVVIEGIQRLREEQPVEMSGMDRAVSQPAADGETLTPLEQSENQEQQGYGR